jgi:hypothetical protein
MIYIYIMTNLDEIAINNIKILAHLDKNKQFITFSDKIFLDSKDKDENYENITELHDIEYALCFSFYQVLTLVKTNYISKKYTRRELIRNMMDAMDNIYDIYEDTMYEDNNKYIYSMLEHIEELIYITSFDIKYYNCYYKFVDYFDYLLTGFNAFYKFSVEFHNIIHPMDIYLSDEDSSNNKSDSENDSESETDNNLEINDTSGYGWDNKKSD